MAMTRMLPVRATLRRPRLRWVDLVVGGAILVVLGLVLRVGQDMDVPFVPSNVGPTISTDPGNIPFYAACSLLRMFVALAASLVFTFIYATVAARSKRAEKAMIPVLDILQSVPVLGFLSITVTAFIALFPGSALGLECASIFAIFTAMAWNMAFAFYYSLRSQPKPLDEAGRLMRLTRWQRFWKLDVPSGMVPLIWNGMLSFGGAWFFLAASETISVLNHQYALPGIGSYVATASSEKQLGKIAIAICVMVVMVVGVNFLFWRPLVAWAEQFRIGDSVAADVPRSVVFDVVRRSSVPSLMARPWRPVGRWLDRATRVFGVTTASVTPEAETKRRGDAVFDFVIVALVAVGVWRALDYVDDTVGLGEFVHAFWLGALTFGRVVIVLIFSTLVWVPIGVWIGMNPRVSRIAQPVVQVFASFPANFVFPIVVAVLIATGISLNWGSILLMALGAQYYVLFNVIAGASTIPNDLREAATLFRLSRWQKWRRLVIPAIFPSYVTGGITASGGAWNASIVAEVVTYGTTLTAAGIGAYIAEATATGNFPDILVGLVVMSVYVVVVNRLFWRRLYKLAQGRYSL